jgi:hypothetical protein
MRKGARVRKPLTRSNVLKDGPFAWHQHAFSRQISCHIIQGYCEFEFSLISTCLLYIVIVRYMNRRSVFPIRTNILIFLEWKLFSYLYILYIVNGSRIVIMFLMIKGRLFYDNSTIFWQDKCARRLCAEWWPAFGQKKYIR